MTSLAYHHKLRNGGGSLLSWRFLKLQLFGLIRQFSELKDTCTFNPSNANRILASVCVHLTKFCNQTIAMVACLYTKSVQTTQRLQPIASAVSHAHLTIYQLLCARITLNRAKTAVSLVKTACVGLSKCVCGCFSCQEDLGGLVVPAFPTVANCTGFLSSQARTHHPPPTALFACRRKKPIFEFWRPLPVTSKLLGNYICLPRLKG